MQRFGERRQPFFLCMSSTRSDCDCAPVAERLRYLLPRPRQDAAECRLRDAHLRRCRRLVKAARVCEAERLELVEPEFLGAESTEGDPCRLVVCGFGSPPDPPPAQRSGHNGCAQLCGGFCSGADAGHCCAARILRRRPQHHCRCRKRPCLQPVPSGPVPSWFGMFSPPIMNTNS